MAILTDSGRVAVAEAMMAKPIHLAWGNGDPAWDITPVPEALGVSVLVAEVGRRKVTQAIYCLPDPEGEIVVTEGRFKISNVPTKYIYLRFAFEFADAADQTIRELGVFVGTVAVSSAPTGQDYITPAEIDNPGRLLVLENIPKLARSPQIRQQFEFVVQF